MVPCSRPQWEDIRTCGNSQCKWRGAMGKGHWASERDSEGVHGPGQFGQQGSKQCAGSIVRGPLISAMNDADHEEFVSMHVISKKCKAYGVTNDWRI